MRKIPLSKGYTALIDDEDFERVSQHKWFAREKSNTVYAGTNILADPNPGHRKWKGLEMHRFIMNAQPGKSVDHIDGNGLNNQKCNLRICTHRQNMANCAAKGKSRYRGVTFCSDGRKKPWRAQIKTNRIGCFKTEKEAALAYDVHVKSAFGEYGRYNFPDYQDEMRGLGSRKKL